MISYTFNNIHLVCIKTEGSQILAALVNSEIKMCHTSFESIDDLETALHIKLTKAMLKELYEFGYVTINHDTLNKLEEDYFKTF